MRVVLSDLLWLSPAQPLISGPVLKVQPYLGMSFLWQREKSKSDHGNFWWYVLHLLTQAHYSESPNKVAAMRESYSGRGVNNCAQQCVLLQQTPVWGLQQLTIHSHQPNNSNSEITYVMHNERIVQVQGRGGVKYEEALWWRGVMAKGKALECFQTSIWVCRIYVLQVGDNFCGHQEISSFPNQCLAGVSEAEYLG